MNKSIVRARIDSDLKDDASRILNSMGLTLSDAIRLMLVQTVSRRELPFSIKAPNTLTMAALEETMKNPETTSSLDEFVHEWKDREC